MSMKGLVKYISDIRSCKTKEAERRRVQKEMAHIRQQFKGGKLDGYQKKKYVAKLVYSYILGYKIDFGHMEAVSLLSSRNYSEKSIGYMACSVLLGERHEMVPLLINCILKDLTGSDSSPNELHQSLALNLMANIGGEDMAESLGPHVQKLIVSKNTSPAVRKKASLALLRLFRRNPSLLEPESWGESIITVLDSRIHGVLLSVLPLLRSLIQYSGVEKYIAAVPKLIDILHGIVIKREFKSDTLFYSLPSPWLQIKVMSLLRMFPPPKDRNDQDKIKRTTLHIISTKPNGKSVNYRNAFHSVLFEAINLALHLDFDDSMMAGSIDLLGQFITATETNIRYLGLEAMANMARNRSGSLSRFLPSVLRYVHDPDISIRQRCLDLIYYLTNKDNYETVIAELLSYLVEAELSLREEIVLKVAILAEKFASTYMYYIDVTFSMMALAGEHISEEIWYRVVQIVVDNDETLQNYACKTLIGALQSPHAHEMLVKIGSYIIGEFGHLVGGEERYSPEEQFRVLSSKYESVSGDTKTMIITSYLKMAHSYPILKPLVKNHFESETSSVNVEIQQRVCEYLMILDDERILAKVCELMPEFSDRVSAVVKRLEEKKRDREGDEDVSDDVVEALNGNEVLESVQNEAGLVIGMSKTTSIDLLGVDAPKESPSSVQNVPVDDDVADLAQVDLSTGSIPAESNEVTLDPETVSEAPKIQLDDFIEDLLDDEGNKQYTEPEFELLTTSSEGVIYEDDFLQIGVKSVYKGSEARFALYYGNKSREEFRQFIIELDDVEGLIVSSKPPGALLPSMLQNQHLFAIKYLSGFISPPSLRVKYVCGSKPHSVRTLLPIHPSKFVDQLVFVQTTFFKSWKKFGQQHEYQNMFRYGRALNNLSIGTFLSDGLHLSVLPGIDPNPTNFVAAGKIICSNGNMEILLRVEINENAMMIRLTIRTENDDENLRKSFGALFSHFIQK